MTDIPIDKIQQILKQYFPKAHIALSYSNNWELLVAVVLSAQCTDKKVNEVTSKIFPRVKNLKLKIKNYHLKLKTTPEIQEIINYVEMDLSDLEQYIRSTGFYRNKAKNIQNAARIILEKYDGRVPKTMEGLTSLPGVARKTANIILGNAFGIIEGIAVDTHVIRISRRLGLTKNSDPQKIEKDLMEKLPKTEWFDFTYRIIDFGRSICDAKHPLCSKCPLNKLCPSAFKIKDCK